jgi:hypothetical protein
MVNLVVQRRRPIGDFALHIPKTFELLKWVPVQKKKAIRAKMRV